MDTHSIIAIVVGIIAVIVVAIKWKPETRAEEPLINMVMADPLKCEHETVTNNPDMPDMCCTKCGAPVFKQPKQGHDPCEWPPNCSPTASDRGRGPVDNSTPVHNFAGPSDGGGAMRVASAPATSDSKIFFEHVRLGKLTSSTERPERPS